MIDKSNGLTLEVANKKIDSKINRSDKKKFEKKLGIVLNNEYTKIVDYKNTYSANIKNVSNNSNISNKRTNIYTEDEIIKDNKKKKNILDSHDDSKLKLENKKNILSFIETKENTRCIVYNREKENSNVMIGNIFKENCDNETGITNETKSSSIKDAGLTEYTLEKEILSKDKIVYKKERIKKIEGSYNVYNDREQCGIDKKNSINEEKKCINDFEKRKEKYYREEIKNNKNKKNILKINTKKGHVITDNEYNKNFKLLYNYERDKSFNISKNANLESKNIDNIMENFDLNDLNFKEIMLHKDYKISKPINNMKKTELKKIEYATKKEFSDQNVDEIKLEVNILEKEELKNIKNENLYNEKYKLEKMNKGMNNEYLNYEKEINTDKRLINEDTQYKKEINNKNIPIGSIKNKNEHDTFIYENTNNNNFNEENMHIKIKEKNNNNFIDNNIKKERSNNNINEENIHEGTKWNNDNLVHENISTKKKNSNNIIIDKNNKNKHTYNTQGDIDIKFNEGITFKKNCEEILNEKDENKNIDMCEFTENNEISRIYNGNIGNNKKKKYSRLLKNLQTNLTKKIVKRECEKRIKSWGDNITLREKINYFIKNKIATKTEYKYGKKPNTLSICNQFNLYNHLTMLNDFNRLHYYRAAMRWTGHVDACDFNNDILSNKENNVNFTEGINNMNNAINNNNIRNIENTSDIFNKERIDNIRNEMSINDTEDHNLNKSNGLQKNNKNPYIFFENNKDCYVYNKNIIEIGTGPLSLLSINAILNGAKHIDALEVNKDASDMAKKLIEGYNLEDYINIINCYSKVYEYKEEEIEKKLKKRNPLYNFFDNSIDKTFCSSFDYDLIISEVIGDFASQEGVADIYLDLHKKIFSYRKYKEYMNNWSISNNNNRSIEYNIKEKNEEKKEKITKKEEIQSENILKKGRRLSYFEFSSNEELYNCEEFYNMNIKSIPYSVTTYYCPVKFPYSDNIIYKSENYPERTIISPQNKLFQSIILDWSNLTLHEKENSDSDNFGVLEYIYLEQNLVNQMIQKRSGIFHIQKNAPFCGFLITIDVEIRKGEHFGTKYGTCDNWYTNIVLLRDEINVKENDIIISKTYTNLLNYSENNIDRKNVLVSRPSYTFYGYILRSIKDECSYTSDSDAENHNKYENSKESNNSINKKDYIYLDDKTILLLDQKDFHDNLLTTNLNKSDYKNSTINEESNIKETYNELDNSIKIKQYKFSENNLNSFDSQTNYIDADNRSKSMHQYKNISDHKSFSNTKQYSINNKEYSNNIIHEKIKTKLRDDISLNNNEIYYKDWNNELINKPCTDFKEKNHSKDYDNSLCKHNMNINTKVTEPNSIKSENKNSKSDKKAPMKSSKNNVNKKKKNTYTNEYNDKKIADKSREKYEKDISDIINNYNLYSKVYCENLKNKIIVYKNFKYKLLSFYEPVVIDYDEQATVIYKKDDIYNSRENNVNKFVNNVYQ